MGGGRRLRRRPLARRSPRWATRRGAHQRPYRARTPGFLLAHLVGREPLRPGVEVPELGHEVLVGVAVLVGLGVFAAVPGAHGDALSGDVDGLQEVVEAVALLPGEDAGDLVAVVQGPHRLRALAGSLWVKVMRTNTVRSPLSPAFPGGFVALLPGNRLSEAARTSRSAPIWRKLRWATR